MSVCPRSPKRAQHGDSVMQKHLENAKTIADLKAKISMLQNPSIKCCRCLNTARMPIRACMASHYFCSNGCVPAAFTKPIPVPLYNTRNLPKQDAHTLQKTITCPAIGCNLVISLDVVKHRRDDLVIAFVGDPVVHCIYDDCLHSGPASSLNKHLLDCDFRTMACHYCEQMVQCGMINDHIRSQCRGFKCVLCLTSTVTYGLRDLQSHLHYVHVHGSSNIRVCLLRRLEYALHIVETSDRYKVLGVPNSEVSYDVLQEALHLNLAMSEFEAHNIAKTHTSTWTVGHEVNESELLEATTFWGVVVPPLEEHVEDEERVEHEDDDEHEEDDAMGDNSDNGQDSDYVQTDDEDSD